MGNERLITGLPPVRCMFFFWFDCAYNIVILYRRKGLLEIEVTVVNKLDIYIKI